MDSLRGDMDAQSNYPAGGEPSGAKGTSAMEVWRVFYHNGRLRVNRGQAKRTTPLERANGVALSLRLKTRLLQATTSVLAVGTRAVRATAIRAGAVGASRRLRVRLCRSGRGSRPACPNLRREPVRASTEQLFSRSASGGRALFILLTGTSRAASTSVVFVGDAWGEIVSLPSFCWVCVNSSMDGVSFVPSARTIRLETEHLLATTTMQSLKSLCMVCERAGCSPVDAHPTITSARAMSVATLPVNFFAVVAEMQMPACRMGRRVLVFIKTIEAV